MAAGDVFIVTPTTVTNGNYLDVRPAASVEVSIHNLYWGGDSGIEVYIYDGSNRLGPIFTDTAKGGWINLNAHATNSIYYQIKNTSGASMFMSADGMTTK